MSPEAAARVIAEALVDCTDRPGDDEPVFSNIEVDGPYVDLDLPDGGRILVKVEVAHS